MKVSIGSKVVEGPYGGGNLFVKNILKNKPINVYNFGNHSRDFTYVDDAVNGDVKALNKNAILWNFIKFTFNSEFNLVSISISAIYKGK